MYAPARWLLTATLLLCRTALLGHRRLCPRCWCCCCVLLMLSPSPARCYKSMLLCSLLCSAMPRVVSYAIFPVSYIVSYLVYVYLHGLHRQSAPTGICTGWYLSAIYLFLVLLLWYISHKHCQMDAEMNLLIVLLSPMEELIDMFYRKHSSALAKQLTFVCFCHTYTYQVHNRHHTLRLPSKLRHRRRHRRCSCTAAVLLLLLLCCPGIAKYKHCWPCAQQSCFVTSIEHLSLLSP